ncbi:MAG: MBL fold metallo-hydrolase [Acidobacteriota bacterium]|nr:MBL fold metallo-hydrolase [Acidobacteriota bacterium]
MVCAQQPAPPLQVAPGVWFLVGDSSKGYSNTTVIEMQQYLIVVDANYPGRARELLQLIPQLSPKPVRYVLDTHAHGDHTYGNSLWTRAGATTVAYAAMLSEMQRYEPGRWQAAEARREDVRTLGEDDVQRPGLVFHGRRMVLQDATRRVEFRYLGWGHTPADAYVWLPQQRILCTGDAAVNGPRNKLWDSNLRNWPRVLQRAIALHPRVVLPGHGASGGVEILCGQRQFLLDLYAAVQQALRRGEEPVAANIVLPERDRNWVPTDLTQDIGIVAAEIRAGRPAGALPHTWR